MNSFTSFEMSQNLSTEHSRRKESWIKIAFVQIADQVFINLFKSKKMKTNKKYWKANDFYSKWPFSEPHILESVKGIAGLNVRRQSPNGKFE